MEPIGSEHAGLLDNDPMTPRNNDPIYDLKRCYDMAEWFGARPFVLARMRQEMQRRELQEVAA